MKIELMIAYLFGLLTASFAVGFGSFWIGNKTNTVISVTKNGQEIYMNGGLYYCHEVVGRGCMVLIIVISITIGALWLLRKKIKHHV